MILRYPPLENDYHMFLRSKVVGSILIFVEIICRSSDILIISRYVLIGTWEVALALKSDIMNKYSRLRSLGNFQSVASYLCDVRM